MVTCFAVEKRAPGEGMYSNIAFPSRISYFE